MKKKIILSTLALGTLAASTYAMYGYGPGYNGGYGWHGMGYGYGLYSILSDEEKNKLQSMTWEERQEYMQKLREKYGFPLQQAQGPKIRQYQEYIEEKYKTKLDKLSQEQIRTIIEKVNNLLRKVMTSNKYDTEKKATYYEVLTALKICLTNRLEKVNSTDTENIINEVLGQ